MTNQPFSKETLPERDRTSTARIQLPFNVSISFKVVISGFVIMSIFFPLLYFPYVFFQPFYSGNYASVSTMGLALLSYAVAMLYFFLAMPYHISSMYLRYATLIPFLVAVALSLIRSGGLPFWPVDFTNSWSDTLVTLVVIGFFGSMSVWVLRGYTYRGPTIQLAFPLRSGCYAVSQGGSNAMINYHANNAAQHYANDIGKLNRWGSRARGIYPRQLDAYCIFGDTVYSPCNGVIVTAIDGLPDLTPGEMDATQPFGNHIVIKYKDKRIFLAHLQQDSILVYPREEVRQGQPIGKVGNSGNTSEPHLHIHVEYNDSTERISNRMGMPIIFKEKGFLKLNDLLVIRDKIPMES